MWTIRLYASIIALLVYCQSPAVAQPSCMPAEAGLADVAAQYGENPLFEGQLASPTGAPNMPPRRFVLTWNPESGSWSLLVADPMGAGLLCMVGSGEGGKPSDGPQKAPGAPS